MKTATYWIEKLELEKHPEGGWYREVYLSEDIVPHTGLPSGFRGERSFSTSIYYLLEGDDFSAFHRIKSDEIWHYYSGSSAIEIVMIENNRIKKCILGDDPDRHQKLQIVVPRNTWFAAKLNDYSGYALAGCTVSPGFHYDDFELADNHLLKEYNAIKDEIAPLLRFAPVTSHNKMK
jgi:uncharacterized protein